jgi:RNA recognition motif-containing protein
MGENGGVMSPDSAGGFVRRAAPEPNKRALYVGGLDPRVTEDVLRQIFETTGHVQNVKIIPDKNVGAVSITFYLCQILENVSDKGCAQFSIKGVSQIFTFFTFFCCQEDTNSGLAQLANHDSGTTG